MKDLHIVQGGITNGDKANLESRKYRSMKMHAWTAPKSASPGDDVVIYIGNYGFFATATIATNAKSNRFRKNRYRANITSIKLIEPAISHAIIKKRIPALIWLNYPRSYTTPSRIIANQIRKLIADRRMHGVHGIRFIDLDNVNIDELRILAMKKARRTASRRKRMSNYRIRSRAIHRYVLARAQDHCEACKELAPFIREDGTAYLEPHHTTRLADDGPDHPDKVIALCPNCHRRAHYAEDSKQFNASLIAKLKNIESKNRR